MKCEIRNEQKLKLDRKKIWRLCDFLGRRFDRPADELVSLYFVDNLRITELNRQYFSRDRQTDVMAFPMGKSGILGDIVVSVEQAGLQSEPGGLEAEILFLLAHGFLHLLGWKDYNKKDREKMLSEGTRALEDFFAHYGQ
ncbi:MAG: rRNA maturation RNase YbeY [Candidatus Wallbacteria bacterium]|nr:rRNA maturation RNase YbeY [Candidatus Wallbacteria bacterium]